MIKPASLKHGDRIAIIAPSRRILPGDVDAAVETFKQWGLDVVLGENLHSKAHSYLAGSDAERLKDFQTSLDDPSIKAVIAARGGYGSTRIVHKLDLSKISENPKWVIGFSDITAVHLKFLSEGIMSIHGTMPILFSKKESQPSIESLRRVLFEGTFNITLESNPKNRFGSAEGKLIGGNLSLVADSLGSTSSPDTKDAILIIEEIDEYVYRLDRMMTQLKSAGKLENLKGLIIGHMTDIKESESPFAETVEEIVLNAVQDYQYPVVFQFPTGHENPNLAWIHGETVKLETTTMRTSLSSASASI